MFPLIPQHLHREHRLNLIAPAEIFRGHSSQRVVGASRQQVAQLQRGLRDRHFGFCVVAGFHDFSAVAKARRLAAVRAIAGLSPLDKLCL